MDRPTTVPSEAVWVGGSDGGVFVKLEKMKQSESKYRTTIFSQNGDIEFDGILLAKNPSDKPVDVSNKEQFTAWDGDTLYLKDGRNLISKQ